jgi:hypothetical protein
MGCISRFRRLIRRLIPLRGSRPNRAALWGMIGFPLVLLTALCVGTPSRDTSNITWSVDPPMTKETCEQAGGDWADDFDGGARRWGCVTKTHDADKPCTKGRDCDSGFCVVREAVCGDVRTENPKGIGYGHCALDGRCFGERVPPKGCFGLLIEGEYHSQCMD